MKKILILLLLPLILGFSLSTANAATSILPGGDTTTKEFVDSLGLEGCKIAVDFWSREYAKLGYSGLPETLAIEGGGEMTADQMMACALKSGNMSFWMMPFFINNVLEFIIGLAGLITVLMIMIGAYFYIAGGITDDKEKGKTIIKYALMGFVLVLASWTLVNLLLLFLTA